MYTLLDSKLIEPGTYYVQATIPSTGNYKKVKSSSLVYKIKDNGVIKENSSAGIIHNSKTNYLPIAINVPIVILVLLGITISSILIIKKRKKR